jgi:hypothetical protein
VKPLRFLALVLVVGSLFLVNAGTVVSVVGDKDCFGLGGSCPDNTLWRDELGGTFWANYQGPGDPAFTDKWGSDVSPSYQHVYALIGTPVSAQLTVKFAGVADNRGPWDVYFNQTLIGEITRINDAGEGTGGTAFQSVRTLTWDVPIALLLGQDSIILNINTPEINDGYSIDYSELTITTADTVVPEPGSWVALMLGLGGLSYAVSRRRKA